MQARVLVIDDCADFAEALEAVLAAAGFNVRVLPDGEGAPDAVEEWQPHVVLLDLGMPYEGRWVLHDLYNDVAWRPVLGLVSAELDAATFAELRGAVDIMFDKGSLRAEELVATLRRYVSLRFPELAGHAPVSRVPRM